MDAFGVPPSRRLGDIMKELERRCDAGELEGQRDAAFYVDYLRTHADDFEL